MEGLINPVTILLHSLNAAILIAALYFLLYKPVRKFMNARSEMIAAALDEAARKQSEAQVCLEKRSKALDDAAQEAMAIERQSDAQAQARAKDTLTAAQQEAGRIIAQAHAQAAAILATTDGEMLNEAAILAAQMSASVLSREVSEKDNERLLQEFISGVGKVNA